MATDISRIIANLRGFYDFSAKTVIDVGAGGGQFAEFGRDARRVIAIDPDARALRMLEQALAASGLTDVFALRLGDFHDLSDRADAVFFEFCLHEMPDPLKAIAHARTLAADVVVADHAPGSEWAYCAAEDEKVRRSSAALRQLGPRAQAEFHAVQRFPDHAALVARVSAQGPVASERCARFAGQTDIVIPMTYSFTLL
jgi:predicted RNA methylase